MGQDNGIIQFKIKKHTPLRKLMIAYCERSFLAKEAVRFRFDGAPVNELDTPETLEMEEGDTIEVYLPQTGGAVTPISRFPHFYSFSRLLSNPHATARSYRIFHSGNFAKLKFI